MLIYNRPYIILVATGDRAYVNLHPWGLHAFTQCGARKYAQLRENSPQKHRRLKYSILPIPN